MIKLNLIAIKYQKLILIELPHIIKQIVDLSKNIEGKK